MSIERERKTERANKTSNNRNNNSKKNTHFKQTEIRTEGNRNEAGLKVCLA